MTRDNVAQFRKDLQRRPFDFVLGSIHFVDGLDVYFQDFWQGKTVWQAERRCLEETLACVRIHDGFDVLAHLTYIGKTAAHPAPRPVPTRSTGKSLTRFSGCWPPRARDWS